MKQKTALRTIFWFSLAGILFSGYLSVSELFFKTCALGIGTCQTVAAIPACVYGFVMYCIVFIFTILGIKGDR